MIKKGVGLWFGFMVLTASLLAEAPTVLLKSQRYDDLEKQYESAASEKVTILDWPQLSQWLYAFEPKTSDSDAIWEERLAALAAWKQANPESKAVVLAQAGLYNAYGYKARGTGWAADVTKDGWRLLEERRAKAEALLLASADRLSEEIGYYYLLASIHATDGGELELTRKYIGELRKRAPAYWPAYSLIANFMLERWGAKAGDLRNYARDAANQLGGERGDILYARMLGYAAYMDEDRFVELHSPDGDRLKRGYEAAIRANKGDRALITYYKAEYAYAAALLGDWVRTKRLLVSIYPVWDFKPWNGQAQYDKHMDTSGARREVTSIQVLEMRGNLDEVEKRYLAAEPDRGLNVALTGFYLRHGRTEDYATSPGAYDLTQTAGKVSLDEAANLSRVFCCLGNFEKAREMALKFDRSRGHNITGKLVLYHVALYSGDKEAAAKARESILALKTDRKGYQLAQAVMRGEREFMFSGNDAPDWSNGYTSQAAIAIALRYYELGKPEEARVFLAKAMEQCRPYDEREWLSAFYYYSPALFMEPPAK
jgi:hypothetical protein